MISISGHSLPRPLHVANETLAFVLEVVMLAGLAWWGAAQHASIGVRIALAIAAPVLVAAAWGLFAAPRARVRLPLAGVLAIKVLAFGAAALGVYAIGRHSLALAFMIVSLANTAIAAVDRQANGGAAKRAKLVASAPSMPAEDS